MIWPPSLLRVQISIGNKGFGLWLPLLIIWPPLLLLGLALAPLVILLALLLWPLGLGRTLILTGPLLFRLFCSLRGLEIAVEGPKERVLINFR